MSILQTSAIVWAATNLTYACSPFLVTVAVFVTFISISATNVLTADKMFVSIALLNR